MPKYEILIVGNDPGQLTNIVLPLEKSGFNITTVECGNSAIEVLEKKYFDLVISDLVMGTLDGFRVLKKAKKMDPNCKVIMLTACRDINFIKDALRLGAQDFLIKPCVPAEILYRVEMCLKRSEQEWKIRLYERILPVCCVCRKIRDDSVKKHGIVEWVSLESYLIKNSKFDISHFFCPECAKKYKDEADGLIENIG